jgi:hypothetical protein
MISRCLFNRSSSGSSSGKTPTTMGVGLSNVSVLTVATLDFVAILLTLLSLLICKPRIARWGHPAIAVSTNHSPGEKDYF